jgi:hypothetical protein
MHAIVHFLGDILSGIGQAIALLRPTNFKQAASLASIVGTGVAGVVAFFQYREGQRWKRIEFVVPQMRDFFEKAETKAVCKMMDWGGGEISLGGNRELSFDRENVFKALCVGPSAAFPQVEATIRELFDSFFTYLENLNSYIGGSNRLFKADILSPYLSYYLRMINMDNAFGQTLRSFISYYEYRGVINLTEVILKEQWRGPSPVPLHGRDIDPPISKEYWRDAGAPNQLPDL